MTATTMAMSMAMLMATTMAMAKTTKTATLKVAMITAVAVAMEQRRNERGKNVRRGSWDKDEKEPGRGDLAFHKGSCTIANLYHNAEFSDFLANAEVRQCV